MMGENQLKWIVCELAWFNFMILTSLFRFIAHCCLLCWFLALLVDCSFSSNIYLIMQTAYFITCCNVRYFSFMLAFYHGFLPSFCHLLLILLFSIFMAVSGLSCTYCQRLLPFAYSWMWCSLWNLVMFLK